MRDSLWLSVKVALLATGIALVLGSMAAFAIHRFSFFGRESVSFLLLLPIALPGIITGMALNSFYVFAGVGFSIWTIVIGHATFCVVIVFNNVLARLRRTQGSLLEASMDLGADGWQTFRFVVWPVLSTALVAGGLLAFALSFDEVIVTTFTAGAQTTLPIFILDNLRQGQQFPIVNVVAFVVILLTIVPGHDRAAAHERHRRRPPRPGHRGHHRLRRTQMAVATVLQESRRRRARRLRRRRDDGGAEPGDGAR